jgi:hypothetical protein
MPDKEKDVFFPWLSIMFIPKQPVSTFPCTMSPSFSSYLLFYYPPPLLRTCRELLQNPWAVIQDLGPGLILL